MALWTDYHSLSLYPTDDPQYYFLEVKDHMQSYIKPFLELKVIDARFHDQLKTGWIISADKFPFINHFLEAFHYANDEDFKHKERNPKYAYIHNISRTEYILLALLNKEIWLASGVVGITQKDLDYAKDDLIKFNELRQAKTKEEHSKIKWDLSYAYGEVSGDLSKSDINEYIQQRGPEVKKGDLLEALGFDIISIYDGKEWISWKDREHNMPKEFTTPPFPIMYWNVEFDDGNPLSDELEINFDRFDPNIAQMEFNNSPYLTPFEDVDFYEQIAEEKEVVSLDIGLHQPLYPGGPDKFSIYFIRRGGPKPTYNEVINIIDKPGHHHFYPRSDTVMVYRL